MLNEQTLNQLRALRLDGMVAALSDAATHITASELPFEQRLALLVQREVDWRDSKRLERLLKAARLKVSSACLEDIDWRASRSLSRERGPRFSARNLPTRCRGPGWRSWEWSRHSSVWLRWWPR